MRHPLSLLAAFLLGACATAAAQSAASPPPPTATQPAQVTPAAQAERRIAPNGKGSVTILARGQNAFLARLELAAGGAVPEHRDATEEYIHVMQGHGTMTIDGTPYTIEPGTTVYMPAHAAVSVQNGDTPLVAFQVFAGPEPAAKYDAWTPAK